MQRLHDTAVREAIETRVRAISAGSKRGWGKMSPDQMLWHCAESLAVALGHKPYEPMKGPPLPAVLMRFLIIALPWPKGQLATAPQFVASSNYDLAAEKERLLGLIDELAARDPASASVPHPLLGNAPIEFQSKLHAKHLNHHLTQFGV